MISFSSSTERDPLAARLDEVLRAVDEVDVALGVDRRDVAGAQPAVLGERLRRSGRRGSSRRRPTGRRPAARRAPRRPTAARRPRPDRRSGSSTPRRRSGPASRAGRRARRRSSSSERALDAGRRTRPGSSRSCPTRAGSAARAARGTPPTAPSARPSRRTTIARSDEVSRAVSSGEHAHPDRRHARRERDALVLDQAGDRRRRHLRARATRASPPATTAACASPQAFAWNIGTTGRITSRSLTPSAVREHRAQRVQHGRAVRVDDALRVAGRAARVAHRRGLVLVRDRGSRRARPRASSVLVVERPAASSGDLARAVVHDHDVAHGREAVGTQRPQRRHERPVDEDDLVLGVVRRCRSAAPGTGGC